LDLARATEVIEDHTAEDHLFADILNKFNLLNENLSNPGERLRLGAELDSLMTSASVMFSEHLEKEETILHPLIESTMDKVEIEKIVGRIMGHRSSDIMEIILKMMVRNLSTEEKDFMLGSMQAAVKDTYFERWLSFLSADLNVLARRENDSLGSHSCRLETGRGETSRYKQLNGEWNNARPSAQDGGSDDALSNAKTTCDGANDEEERRRRSALLSALELIASCDGLNSEEKSKVMSALACSDPVVLDNDAGIRAKGTKRKFPEIIAPDVEGGWLDSADDFIFVGVYL